MKVSKTAFIFFVVIFCLISINVKAANASEQICLNLSPDPAPVGSGPTILKLGIMYSGNFQATVAGTDTRYIVPGLPDSVGLVHGNAEIVNDKLEISLNGSVMWSDNKTNSVYSYHLRLDPTTLSGVYTATALASGVMEPKGIVSVVSCSGLRAL